MPTAPHEHAAAVGGGVVLTGDADRLEHRQVGRRAAQELSDAAESVVADLV